MIFPEVEAQRRSGKNVNFSLADTLGRQASQTSGQMLHACQVNMQEGTFAAHGNPLLFHSHCFALFSDLHGKRPPSLSRADAG